jgi:hypothetical protein
MRTPHKAASCLNCFSSSLVRLGYLMELFVEQLWPMSQGLSFSSRAKSSGLIGIRKNDSAEKVETATVRAIKGRNMLLGINRIHQID